MDTLPPKLIQRIANFLPPKDFSSFKKVFGDLDMNLYLKESKYKKSKELRYNVEFRIHEIFSNLDKILIAS